MKKNKINWKTIIIAVALSTIVAYLVAPTAQVKQEESVYDRVMRTGKIKCGYVAWAPGIIKDPTTGEISGIFHDYIEEIGRRVSIDIEWGEEVTFGAIPESLKNERFDIYCSTVWPTSARGVHMDFIEPLYYDTLEGFVRKGDKRFHNNKDVINDEGITIATIDGEVTDMLARDNFPEANILSHPNITSPDTTLMGVVTGKSDITFTDLVNGRAFMEKNPGKLEIVEFKKPLRIAPNHMAVKKGEYKLRSMLDIATQDLIFDGTVDNIIKKYEQYPDTLIRTSSPIER